MYLWSLSGAPLGLILPLRSCSVCQKTYIAQDWCPQFLIMWFHRGYTHVLCRLCTLYVALWLAKKSTFVKNILLLMYVTSQLLILRIYWWLCKHRLLSSIQQCDCVPELSEENYEQLRVKKNRNTFVVPQNIIIVLVCISIMHLRVNSVKIRCQI